MFEFFAIVPPGLEAVAAREAERLGATATGEVPGGVTLRGDLPTLVALHLGARIPSRILLRLAECPLPAFRSTVRNLDLLPYVRKGTPFTLEVSGGGARPSELSRPLEEALARLGAKGAPPGEGVQTFHVRLSKGVVTLSLDASGAHLHQRGYRQETGVAPLRENLAAGILALAGYDPTQALLDPMCGSGTFLIEGAMMALGKAPGAHRSFAFEGWPCVDSASVDSTRRLWESKERSSLPAPIVGSDRNAGALGVTRRNAQRAGVLDVLRLERRDALEIQPPAASGLLVTNPPYGKRVGEVKELQAFHRAFGKVLRERFHGWTAAVFVSDPSYEEAMELPVGEVHRLRNGGIPCRLVIARL